jgi:hypothetical protein
MSEFPPYQGVLQAPPARTGSWPKTLGALSMMVTVGLVSTIVAAVAGLAIQMYGRSADTALGLIHPTLILVTLIFTGVTFIRWLYRARVNLYHFGMYDLKWKSGWTIGGWFIPIVNIVIPLIVVNEVDRASATRANAAGGRFSGRADFVLWAITWSGYLLLDRFTTVATPSIVDMSARDLDRFTGLALLATLLQIAAAVFAIRLVRRVTANQERILSSPPPSSYVQPGFYAQAPSYAQPASYEQAAFPPKPYQPPSPAVGTGPASVAEPAPPPPDPLRPPSDPWPSAGF